LPPSPKKGFPWNWVQALEIKIANDGAIGPKKNFDNNFHLCDRRMDRQTDKWTPDNSKDCAYA